MLQVQEDFPKAFFKALYKRSKEPLLYLERYVLNLLSAKTRQKSNA